MKLCAKRPSGVPRLCGGGARDARAGFASRAPSGTSGVRRFRRTRRFRAAVQPLSRGFLSFMIGGVGESGIAALPPGLRRFGRTFWRCVCFAGIEHQKLARIGPQSCRASAPASQDQPRLPWLSRSASRRRSISGCNGGDGRWATNPCRAAHRRHPTPSGLPCL
jgi:hypothetical protein